MFQTTHRALHFGYICSVQAVASPQNRCYYCINGETEARWGVGRIGNLPKIPQLSDKITIQTWYVSFHSLDSTKTDRSKVW